MRCSRFLVPASAALLTLLCTTTCVVQFSAGPEAACGNGLLDPDEECDDGNRVHGDGCGGCQVEDGHLCHGEPSVCTTWCGDGVARGDEECDGDDLRGTTCADLGLTGDLECTEACTFDELACGDHCGNGFAGEAEVCDGTDFKGEDCEGLGFYVGELVCDADCRDVDTTGCTGFCGDGIRNGPEPCDATRLAGRDCASFGFYGGDLGCLADCSGFDSSQCTGHCGDGVQNGPETCDGDDVGSDLCSDHGFFGGTLGCQTDCNALDTSQCWDEPRVIINEVDLTFPDRVELVNLSELAVQLNNWILEWHALGEYGGTVQDQLVLPIYLLGPGERVILRDDIDGPAPPDVIGNLIHFHQNISWGSRPGAAVLLDNVGTPKDFVRWSRATFDPPAGTGWTDPAAGPLLGPGFNNSWMSLSRVPDLQDTDQGGDFCVTDPSIGSPNTNPCVQYSLPGTLLITEVQDANPDRVELHNPGTTAVNLLGWGIKGRTWQTDPLDLPDFDLQPGAYVEIVGDNAGAPYVDGNNVIHIGDININAQDTVALLEPLAWACVDFVRFGGDDTEAYGPDYWEDAPAALPNLVGASLGRSTLTDTDTAADWCLMIPSFGVANGACQ